MQNNSNADIHIVGAGLSGTLLAVLLAKLHGVKVNLYESRQDMRSYDLPAGRSINLALAKRGIDALDAAGLMKEVKQHTVPMYGRQLHHVNDEQSMAGYSKDLSQAIYSLSRPKLNEILLNAAEDTGLVNVYFEHTCTGNDTQEQILQFNDDISIPYKICIGADGFSSKIRENSIANKFVTIEPLGHSYKELSIPKKNNNYQMVVNALHIWPRGKYMLIALPNTDKTYTATLFLPDNDDIGLSKFVTESDVLGFFEQNFSDIIPLIPDLVEQFFNNPIGKLATVRCEQWFYKNTVLIGDAAHAIVPFHGQGMNCAFEDALCFSNLYGKHQGNIIKIKPEYEYLRKNNANAIADMAIENYTEMRDTVSSNNYKLKKQVLWLLQDRYPDEFIPRYNMVMFENSPYAEVKMMGEYQDKIINELIKNLNSMGCKDNIEMLDLSLLDRLIGDYIKLKSEL